MNRSMRHHFSVRRVLLPALVAFCAVGALTGLVVAQQDDEAKVQECWDVMRQYARHLNDGDTASAYKLLVVPLRMLMTEADFHGTTSLSVEELGPLVKGEEATEELAEAAKIGPIQYRVILRVERPEVQGRTAVADVIVAFDPTIVRQLRGLEALADKGDIEAQLRGIPFWCWVFGIPTTAAQLDTLGVSPEECDLVEDLEGVLGDPGASYWPVHKEWLVACLDKDDRWGLLPPLNGARRHECSVDAVAREFVLGMVMSQAEDGGDESIPSVSPRPPLTDMNYVRWTAVETNPAKCPECGEYMRCKWKYCPDCGIELKKEGLAEPNTKDSTER